MINNYKEHKVQENGINSVFQNKFIFNAIYSVLYY